MRTLTLTVSGIPVPKGSATAFYNKHLKRAMVVQTNKDRQKPWVSTISTEAARLNQGNPPTRGNIIIERMTFTFPRPKAHFGTGKNAAILKNSAPATHTQTPDLDKLVRCVLDALTGIIWADDSQVHRIDHAEKIWSHTKQPGLTLTLNIED